MDAKKVYNVNIDLSIECNTLDEATDAMKYVQDAVAKMFEEGGGLSHCIHNEKNEYHSIQIYTKDNTEKE